MSTDTQIAVNLWLNHHGPTLSLTLMGVVVVAFGLLLVRRLFKALDAAGFE